MSMEAYSVAVKLRLVNGVSGGLAKLGGELRLLNKETDTLQQKLNRTKTLLATGMLIGGTGVMGLYAVKKTVEHASEYAHQLSLMNSSGMKHLDIINATNKAWAVSRSTLTTTAAENIEAIRELRSAFGSGQEGHALAILDTVQKAKAIMTSLSGKNQDHFGFDMVKAIEQRTPLMTEDALKRNAELMTQTLIGMGGTLSVNDFHMALKYGKMATMKWDDDFTYKYLPTYMQEMKVGKGGVSTAGRNLMSMYQATHGRLEKSAMPFWVEAGLVKQNDIVKNDTGHYQIRPGAVAGLDLFERNPFIWVQKYLAPGVHKIMEKRHVSAETAINSIFHAQTAQIAAYTMYLKAQQFERDKKLIEQADGIGTYQKLLKTDPQLAELALKKQWQNILATLGYTIMPQLITVFNMASEKIAALNKFMREHEGAVKVLMIAFTGLSAAMAITGGVFLLAAGFNAVNTAVTTLRGAGANGGIGGLIPLITGPVGLVAAFVTLGGMIGWVIAKIVKGARDQAGQKHYKLMPSHGQVPFKHDPFNGYDPHYGGFDPKAVSSFKSNFWDAVTNPFQYFGLVGHRSEQRSSSVWDSLHGNNPTFVVHNTVDERGITTKITRTMERSMDRPQTGISGPDYNMMYPSPANP